MPFCPREDYNNSAVNYRKVPLLYRDSTKYFLKEINLLQECCYIFRNDEGICAHFVFYDSGIIDLRTINFNIIIHDEKDEIYLPECTVSVHYEDDDKFIVRLTGIMKLNYSSVFMRINWITKYNGQKINIEQSFSKITAGERKQIKLIQEMRNKYANVHRNSCLRKRAYICDVEHSAWNFYPFLKQPLDEILISTNTLRTYKPNLPSENTFCQFSQNDIKIDIKCTYTPNYYCALHFVRNYVPVSQSFDGNIVSYTLSIAKEHLELIMLLYYLNGGDQEVESFLYSEHPAMQLKKGLDMLLLKYEDCDIFEKSDVVLSAKETLNNYFSSLEVIKKKTYKALLKSKETHGRWSREYQLYSLIKILFPDAIFQYSAPWLERQTLDIFIPSENFAIECQGEQHYKPVDFFGGEEGFVQTKVRDAEKRIKCGNQGVTLIEWPYYRTIFMNTVLCILATYYPNSQIFQERIEQFSKKTSISTMESLLFNH